MKRFISSFVIFTLALTSFTFFTFLLESANASVGEFFASSAKTLGIAGQSTLNSNDAENNYYAPALLGFNNKTTYSLSSFYINTDFDSINNVVTKNSVSDNLAISSYEYGKVDTNYDPVMMGAFHANVPLFQKRLKTRLGVSFFFPYDKLMETSSGDYFTPEYLMYRTRYTRTNFMFNLIQPFYKNGKPDWSISIGISASMETTGETFMVARGFGDTGPTTGKLKFTATPKSSPVLSYAKFLNAGTLYVSYQHKMETKLSTDASGYTPISTGNGLPFDLTLKSVLYFDPSILRVGYKASLDKFTLISTLEFQQWSGYKTPKIEIISRSGFNSSSNYENVTTRDIIVPKVAATFRLAPRTTVSAGFFYKQSPIINNLNENGNSIDTDVTAVSFGTEQQAKIFGEDFKFTAGYQHHFLKNQRVSKTSGKEDGSTGNKVGSPGYRIGGTVQIVSLGVSWKI